MSLLGPVRFHGRHGFLNPQGQWAIEPLFTNLGDFQEGLASFESGGKLGFIDATGAVVIEPRFDIPQMGCWVCGFREGMAAVTLNGEMGYIDRTGAFVIAPRPNALGWNFVEGRVIVSSEAKGYEIIDRAGQQLTHLDVYEVPFLQNWPKDWNCFTCLFSIAHRFLEGAMNWRGEIVFPPKYAGLGEFYEGVAPFAIEEDHRDLGPQGLVRLDGSIFIEPSFLSIGNFSDGLAPAAKQKKQFGFINTGGDFVIPPIYEQVLPFHEGLACVTVKGKKGFINSRGEMVIEPRFKRQSSFRNGFAQMEYDNTLCYIDPSGRILWERPLEQGSGGILV